MAETSGIRHIMQSTYILETKCSCQDADAYAKQNRISPVSMEVVFNRQHDFYRLANGFCSMYIQTVNININCLDNLK